MPKFIDLTGQKFGRLEVIKQAGKDKWGKIRWLCRCDCKGKIIVFGYSLKNGHTQSCGCLRIKHGHAKDGKETPTYKSWQQMIQRCTNLKYPQWKDYGGRGIRVCKRWLNSFENFLEDIGEKHKGRSLDRKNNNKNYCKSNCRWATPKEQARNTRGNLYITHGRKTQLLVEWSEEIGIPYRVLWKRIYVYGWPLEKALTTPVRKYKKIGEFKT